MKSKYQAILWCLIFLFIAYFIFLSFSRHDNFYSRRLDLGNMEQTVWNVTRGNGFTMTNPAGDQQESRLAVHADFLLIFLAPFYYLWSDPKMLLLIQTIVVELGALPLFWIARDKLKSEKIALLFSASYLLYPPLQRMLLHDFHSVALSAAFLLFAYWYMQKGKYFLFLLFGLLAALGKEEVWLITGLMGLYMVIFKRKKVLGLITAVLSFTVLYLLMWKVIPSATTQGQHFALTYLSDFGDNQNQIMRQILTKPLLVLSTIFQKDRLFYYWQILIPTGLLSLFSPLKMIFAIPELFINSLSNNQLMRQIDYQYNSAIAPFIFITAIDGYYVLRNLIKKLPATLPVVLLAVVLITSYLWGELPFERQSRFSYFTTVQLEKEVMQKATSSLDPKYSVSVTNNIGSHVSGRKYLYNYPVNAGKADYVLIQLGDQYAWPSGKEQEKVLQQLLTNPGYNLISQQGNFYAFKKANL